MRARKLIIAAVFVLALAVTATAQAEHRFTKNGAPIAGTVPAVALGTLTFSTPNDGSWTCRTWAGLSLSGQIAQFRGGLTGYDCEAPYCEAKAEPATLHAGPEEWAAKLGQGTTQMLEIGIPGAYVWLELGCRGKAPEGPFVTYAGGTLTPEVENGSSVGAAPSKLVFGASSGTLEGTTATGRLKLFGYEGMELVREARVGFPQRHLVPIRVR